MRTGRRPDTITDERQVAERVRKLEVMPHTRPIQAPAWAPDRDDLYAIAGHVTMLGCFSRPFQTGGTGPWAKVHQASQYLWAALDERNFRSRGEAQEWTAFLAQMGALIHWYRYPGGYVFDKDPLTPLEAQEVRPQIPYGPRLRMGFAAGTGPAGEHVFQARALWWTGYNPDTTWLWTPMSDIGDLADFDVSGYRLWDNSGPYNQGHFENSIRPVGAQTNTWINALPEPDEFVPCQALPDQYSSHVHFGTPMGPFDTHTALPCPGMPISSPGASGTIYRYRLVNPGHDMYLLCPPRIQHPDLLSNDLWSVSELSGGEITPVGPSLEWLAEGANTLLPGYPQVATFYSQYLPIAYGSARRAHHYNWQQLQTSVSVRGRVEAQYQPDRVLLKGQLYCYSKVLDAYLFYWPDEWPHPADVPAEVSYNAHDGTGAVIALNYERVNRRFSLAQRWRNDHIGPVTVRLDGIIIPLRLDGVDG